MMYELYQIAEEQNLHSNRSIDFVWFKCDINHPKAKHDLKRASIYQQTNQ